MKINRLLLIYLLTKFLGRYILTFVLYPKNWHQLFHLISLKVCAVITECEFVNFPTKQILFPELETMFRSAVSRLPGRYFNCGNSFTISARFSVQNGILQSVHTSPGAQPTFCSNKCRCFFPPGIKVAGLWSWPLNHLIVLRLRLREAIYPLPHMTSWHTHGEVCYAVTNCAYSGYGKRRGAASFW